MTNKLFQVEQEFQNSLKKKMPDFRVGDTLKVTYKIVDKEKTRRHSLDGIVIKMQNALHRRAFTIRKLSYGEGMEVTFPLYSPILEKIKVVQKAKRTPRRARLYYLRGRVGKKATTV